MSRTLRVGAASRRVPRMLPIFWIGLALLLGGCGSSPAQSPPTMPSASSVPACAAASTPSMRPILYTLVGSPTAAGQGIASTTLEALDAQHGCLLWQVSQAGQAQYDLGQGLVYLVTRPDFVYSTTPKMSTVFAYDARTGTLRWKVQEPVAGGIVATPEGVLFVESAKGTGALPLLTYVALSAADGKPQWTYQTTLSLVVFGTTGYLYGLGDFPNLPYPNAVTALDLATGAERWQVSEPTTPLWLVADSQAVYLGEEGDRSGQINTLVALSAQDGQQLWKIQTPGNAAPPVSAGSILYLETNTTPTANAAPKGTLIALNAADGSQRWSVPTDVLSGLVVVNDTLFGSLSGSHPGVQALKSSDGSLLWKVATDLSPTSLLVASGAVYIGLSGQSQGKPDLIEALSASDGSVRWTIQTGGIIQEGLSLDAGG